MEALPHLYLYLLGESSLKLFSGGTACSLAGVWLGGAAPVGATPRSNGMLRRSQNHGCKNLEIFLYVNFRAWEPR